MPCASLEIIDTYTGCIDQIFIFNKKKCTNEVICFCFHDDCVFLSFSFLSC